MSEYQRLKARALELQREKEYELKRELARKAEAEKKAAKEEEERRKRIEAATKEARRQELMRANAALHKASAANTGPSDGYDPFAEDAFSGPSKPPPRSTPKTNTRPNANATHGRPGSSNSRSATRPRPPTTKGKADTPALGRKEKAALKLQRASKGAVEDSLFSVRALVEGRDSRPGSGTSSPRPPPRPAPKSVPPRSTPVGATKSMKSMSQMKKGVDVSTLRPLCPDRDNRDRRNPDEIQRDIRMRKGVGPGTSAPRPGDRDRDRPSRPAPRPDYDRRDGRERDRRDRDRRRHSSSDYDSPSPPRKRSRGDEEPSRSSVSAMIQEMFSRGRPTRQYDEYDSGSDMEAGLSDVEMEEKRALKIARREDEEAEREENARREAKERLRRERAKRGQ